MNPKVILETALNREEISAIESLILMLEGDTILSDISHVADTLNQKANHNVVSYVRSTQINYTNICTTHCTLCAFHSNRSSRHPFSLTPQAVVDKIKETQNIREIQLQGGLNSNLDLNYHIRLLRSIREACPSISIQGYSPQLIRFIAKRGRTTIFDVLRKFRDAGLDSMPGTGAAILNDKVRKKICPQQLKTHEWIDLIRTAHRLGIATTATILVGHIENDVHISEHLDIIKNIQKDTGGFSSFTAIPYSSFNGRQHRRRDSAEDFRMMKINAIGRIFYHRFIKTIEVDIEKCGLPTAVKCLSSGANDCGSLHQHIYPSLMQRPASYTYSAIRNEIIKSGKIPIERHPHRHRSALSPMAVAAARSMPAYARTPETAPAPAEKTYSERYPSTSHTL